MLQRIDDDRRTGVAGVSRKKAWQELVEDKVPIYNSTFSCSENRNEALQLS